MGGLSGPQNSFSLSTDLEGFYLRHCLKQECTAENTPANRALRFS